MKFEILRWVGIFFFLISILASIFLRTWIATFVFALGLFVLFPGSNRLIKRCLRFQFSRNAKIDMVMALLLVGFVAMNYGAVSMERASSATPMPTPVPTPVPTPHLGVSGVLDGRIKGISFEKDKYYAGEPVIARMEMENTGTMDITSERATIKVTCTKLNDPLGGALLASMSEEERSRTYTMDFSESIKPGQTKTLSASFAVPEKLYGISLAGDYDILVTLSINGKTIGAMEVKLTLY